LEIIGRHSPDSEFGGMMIECSSYIPTWNFGSNPRTFPHLMAEDYILKYLKNDLFSSEAKRAINYLKSKI
jgi:hypothetical protein